MSNPAPLVGPSAPSSTPVAPVKTSRRLFSTLEGVLHEEVFFLILSVFIGIFSGLAVVCFRLTIDWMHLALLGPLPQTIAGACSRFHPCRPGGGRTRNACLPGHSRQRSESNQIRALHLQRIHPVSHRRRKIHLRRHRHRFRSIARAEDPSLQSAPASPPLSAANSKSPAKNSA